MEVRDEALAQAAGGGDRSAFAALLDRHYDRIFRIARTVLGSREEAEDLTQDVALALPDKLRKFRGEARFTTWLYRVVINASRDRLRRDNTYRAKLDTWGELDELERGAAATTRDALQWMDDVMAKFAPNLRETVALVLTEGRSHAEAAEVLGVSEGTVSWRMAEVRNCLKDHAKEEGLVQ